MEEEQQPSDDLNMVEQAQDINEVDENQNEINEQLIEDQSNNQVADAYEHHDDDPDQYEHPEEFMEAHPEDFPDQSEQLTTLVMGILKAVATSTNQDKSYLFNQMNRSDAQGLSITEPDAFSRGVLPQLLQKVDQFEDGYVRLLIVLLNLGNFMEIEAEYLREINSTSIQADPLYQKLQQVLGYIVGLPYNQQYINLRNSITIQVQNGKLNNIDDLMFTAKEQLLVMSGISGVTRGHVLQVDYDQVAWKVRTSAIEYFIMGSQERLFQAGSTQTIAICLQAQQEFKNVLEKELVRANQDQGYMQGLNQMQSSKKLTMQQILEPAQCATNTTMLISRPLIDKMTDREIFQQALMLLQQYANGSVPGSATPSRIQACSDEISLLQLRAVILKMATDQVQQFDDVVDNLGIKARADRATKEMMSQVDNGGSTGANLEKQQIGKMFSETQQVSIREAVIGSTSMKLTGSWADSYKNRMLDPYQQNAGGANGFSDQVQFAATGDVMKFPPEAMEVAQQLISIMIACVRVRYDALIDLPGELVSQNDLTLLLAAQRLLKYCTSQGSANNLMHLTRVLIAGVVEGNNKAKLVNMAFGIDNSMLTQAKDAAESFLRNQMQAIPMFENKFEDGGDVSNFANFLQMCYLSICDEERQRRDIDKRLSRRSLMFTALSGSFI